jgi:hypothetical protein
MSGDEVFAMIVSCIAAAEAWGGWFVQVIRIGAMRQARGSRALLILTPLLCGMILFLILAAFAASDVRDSAVYMFFYMVMGAAWVGMIFKVMPLMGISPRLDALERNNRAAQIATYGCWLGLTLCFAGANIGEGPGWWVVVFAALLSTASFFALWGLLNLMSRIADGVSIDRDTATGLRLAGFLIAMGVILGRSVAGNWVSASATVRDFLMMGWPALLLTIAAAVIERISRPTPENPSPNWFVRGLVPGVGYIALSLFYLAGAASW